MMSTLTDSNLILLLRVLLYKLIITQRHRTELSTSSIERGGEGAEIWM